MDNSTEHTRLIWARDRHVRLHYVAPGKPTPNAYVESFNGKFRYELLNENTLDSLGEAREEIERWRVLQLSTSASRSRTADVPRVRSLTPNYSTLSQKSGMISLPVTSHIATLRASHSRWS